MHIPKTAGTSVRHSAQLYFGEERALLLYGDGVRTTSPVLQERYYGTWATLSKPKRFEMLSRYLVESEAAFFASHIQMSRLSCFAPEQAFAIFREPVARVISHYYQYLKRNPKLSLEEFMEMPRNQNVQYRTLGKTELEQIGVIGLQDQFEESIARINHFFQIGLNVEKKNTSPMIVQIKNRFIPRRLLQRIEDLNGMDMDLYERAQKRFKDQA
jgi:uncharacterized protein YllA (UPF0747 family)